MTRVILSIFLFLKDFIYLFERHRVREGEHKQRGGVEGEGGADTPLNRETDAGLDTRFWDHDLSQRQTFNRLNHPSILIIFQLSKNLSHCGFDLPVFSVLNQVFLLSDPVASHHKALSELASAYLEV